MERLTRNDLRQIRLGETKVFALPDARACNNAKALAYTLQREEKCKYSLSTDYATNELTVTKNAL